MTTAPTLTASAVVDGVREVRAAQVAAAVTELELVAAWAALHPCGAGETAAHWGEVDLHGEGTVPLAGPGAPLVAEFAPAVLGAELRIGAEAARQLVGDALELIHRLPRLWDHVRGGRVMPWTARAIARETRDLGPEAARYADRLLAATPDRIGQVHVSRLVDEARLYFDPDRAAAKEESELERRGVWRQRGATPGTTRLDLVLDTPDALAFECTVADIAHELGACGDERSLDQRRASAVGIMADPQHALDLLHGDPDTVTEAAIRPHGSGGTTTLFLHVDADDLAAGVGGTIEKLGPATLPLLEDWLRRCTAAGGTVVVRPVLDLARTDEVDRHDPPAWMRELVLLRDPHCVFPGCRRDSRACDLDHISEYAPLDEGGPPGQTRPDNLAPLCRTHHRVKTHSAWTYKRVETAAGPAYTWTSPTGHQYDVTCTPRHPRRA